MRLIIKHRETLASVTVGLGAAYSLAVIGNEAVARAIGDAANAAAAAAALQAANHAAATAGSAIQASGGDASAAVVRLPDGTLISLAAFAALVATSGPPVMTTADGRLGITAAGAVGIPL